MPELLTQFPVLNKVDIFPGENVKSSGLGKRRCSHKLRITYYRKSDNWSGSFNQFLGQQECIFLGKKNTFYEEYLQMAASSTVYSEQILM